MFRYSLNQIIGIANSQSAFYKKLYNNIQIDPKNYDKLPIVDYDEFMFYLQNGKEVDVFTEKLRSGYLSTSSSTTGFPKTCFFSKKEWIAMCSILGRICYETGTIENGDVIANLTMPGRMRTSFLVSTYSHIFSPADCIDVPICGTEETSYIVEACIKNNVNVLAGLSYTLLNVAYYLAKNGIKLNVKKIFYGGELMYGGQLRFLKEVFPGARIVSYMYGSNETGLVGYSTRDCDYNEHRFCSESCIGEIIDQESKLPITEKDKQGMIVVTSLIKITLPIIRVPTGDIGMWIGNERGKDRKFKLCGRMRERRLKIQNHEFMGKDFRNIADSLEELGILRIQLVLEKVKNIDALTLKVCVNPLDKQNMSVVEKKILKIMQEKYPTIFNNEKLADIFNVKFIEIEDIEPTTKSAKHGQVLDNTN